jgi:hypothetical protein
MTSRRVLVATLLSLTLASGLGACGDDDGDGDDAKVTAETTGSGQNTQGTAESLKARLSGAEEVPGPGVANGVGAVLVDITGTRGCYDLKVTMGEKPTKAHIHQGVKGASGPVVVDLNPAFEPGESSLNAKSCVDLAADLVAKLLADPAAYYINVHSEAHPDGAVRGQLEKF